VCKTEWQLLNKERMRPASRDASKQGVLLALVVAIVCAFVHRVGPRPYITLEVMDPTRLPKAHSLSPLSRPKPFISKLPSGSHSWLSASPARRTLSEQRFTRTWLYWTWLLVLLLFAEPCSDCPQSCDQKTTALTRGKTNAMACQGRSL
jgi:hypothetical protein